jgi:hypothetical protein
MTVGVLITLGTFYLGPVSSITAGVVTTWLTTYLEPQLHTATNWPDHPDPDADRQAAAEAMEKYAKGLALVHLIKDGQVTGPDGNVLDLTSSDSITKVWENPSAYHITGTNPPEPVKAVLDGVGDQFSPAP